MSGSGYSSIESDDDDMEVDEKVDGEKVEDEK